MSRTIRPIGPVTTSLRRLGFRQYAAVFEDGKQVPKVSVLSKEVDGKIKFVGHWIDGEGKPHHTNPLADMKKAARRIMAIREDALMIDCPGCGTRHSDDDMCPED